MIQTATQTPKIIYSAPSFKPTARIAAPPQIDAETRHRIYDRLLDLLAGLQIRSKKTGAPLPFILHPLTKSALISEHGFTTTEINEQEQEIVRDAEYFRDYEVERDVPVALHHAFEETDETNSIFDDRIVGLPGLTLNALTCVELQKEFGRKMLLRCDGFVEVRAADGRGFIHRAVRLDVSGSIIRNGFLVPIHRGGLIAELKVFRHPHDRRPFKLKSRITEENQ